MARTIMEDYYKRTVNHFELAHDIARRAREIQRRGDALVAEHEDKPIVVALREISERQSHFVEPEVKAEVKTEVETEVETKAEADTAA